MSVWPSQIRVLHERLQLLLSFLPYSYVAWCVYLCTTDSVVYVLYGFSAALRKGYVCEGPLVWFAIAHKAGNGLWDCIRRREGLTGFNVIFEHTNKHTQTQHHTRTHTHICCLMHRTRSCPAWVIVLRLCLCRHIYFIRAKMHTNSQRYTHVDESVRPGYRVKETHNTINTPCKNEFFDFSRT